MRPAILLSLMILASCATHTSAYELSPSSVNREKEELDGRSIEVEGWLIARTDEVAIWDKKTDRDENKNPDKCLSILITQEKLASVSAASESKVRVRGVFYKDIRRFKPVMFYNLCNLTAIDVESVEIIRAND
jgi:hypothetical protein